MEIFTSLIPTILEYLAKLVMIFQPKLYITESIDTIGVDFNYYPHSVPGTNILFSFKVSPISRNNNEVGRNALVFTIVNTSEKPIKINKVISCDKRKKEIPLTPIVYHDQLPSVLEPLVGEIKVCFLIDQLRAVSMVLDGRVKYNIASLFYYTDLPQIFNSINIIMSNGKSHRYKLSKAAISDLQDMINENPKLYFPYDSSSTCSVEGCSNKPAYTVLLYDQYENGSEFIEQDYTCPFLCEEHMQENERGIRNKGDGDRRFPRGVYKYPHTNKNYAQGYTKYLPLNHH